MSVEVNVVNQGLACFKLNASSPDFVPCVALSDSVTASDSESHKQKLREAKMLLLVQEYIGDENLLVDHYLQYAMACSSNDFIKLNTICSFNRLKKLKANVKRLAELLACVPFVELNESGKAFRRKYVIVCVTSELNVIMCRVVVTTYYFHLTFIIFFHMFYHFCHVLSNEF